MIIIVFYHYGKKKSIFFFLIIKVAAIYARIVLCGNSAFKALASLVIQMST